MTFGCHNKCSHKYARNSGGLQMKKSKKCLRIKLKIWQACGHFIIEKLPLTLKGLKRYFYLRRRLCCSCWQEDQKIRKIWITKKLGLRDLRGSRIQFAGGMYIRGGLALELLDEGFIKKCIIPFLNIDLSAGWWIRHRNELKALFLEFVDKQNSEGKTKLTVKAFPCYFVIY